MPIWQNIQFQDEMLRNDPPNNHLQKLSKSLIFPEPAVSDLVCEIWQHLVASIHTAGTESVCVFYPPRLSCWESAFSTIASNTSCPKVYIQLYITMVIRLLINTKVHTQGYLSPLGTNMVEQIFGTLWRGPEHIKGKSQSNIKKPLLLLQYRYDILWEALLQPHLDRPESSAHFSAAVLFCSFQVSPPTPEDQQSALQLPQVVSVPWSEGTAIATLQVTKINQWNPYEHAW